MSRNRGRKYQLLLSGRQIDLVNTALAEWGSQEEELDTPEGRRNAQLMMRASDSIRTQRARIDAQREAAKNGNRL